MRRRTFLQSTLALGLAHSALRAQELSQGVKDAALSINPLVWPEERREKREYDRSRPDIITWKEYANSVSYPPGTIARSTYGFIEAAATATMIPLFRGMLVRYDIPQSSEPGFYFYFGITISRLALPRKVRGKPTDDRYVAPTYERSIENESYPAGWVVFDHRKIRLIERDRVSMPTGEVWYGGGSRATGEPPLLSVDQYTQYPRRTSKHPTVDISGIIRFDILHKPVRFKLELPPLQFGDICVPLSVSYFEPYDKLNKRWL